MPVLDVKRCAVHARRCRPEVRLDVAPHRSGRNSSTRSSADFGLDTLQPRVEELAQRRACRRDERSTLKPGHRVVERGLGFLLGVEPARLALTSLTDIIEAEIDAVAPRSALGSRLANAPSHAHIVNRFRGILWAIRGHETADCYGVTSPDRPSDLGFHWSRVRGSNSPPHDYKSSALPTELTRRRRRGYRPWSKHSPLRTYAGSLSLRSTGEHNSPRCCSVAGHAPAGLPGSVSGRSPALRAARTRLGPLAGDRPRARATVAVGFGLWKATASR